MIDLDELEVLCNEATPGPWWNDSGNGQIESRNEVYYRAVVCDRAESFRFNPVNSTSTDPRYEMCPDAPRINPESDMEFIAAARTAVPELIAEIRRLREEVERRVDAIQAAGTYQQALASAIMRRDPTFDFQRKLWTDERKAEGLKNE